MIPYKVGKLTLNTTHSTRRLVKYVPGRGYFVPSPLKTGTELLHPLPLQSLNGSEAILLRYIWNVIFPDGDVGCTTVHEDNVGALHLANNPATTPNSNHIDIRHHFIRERVANGEFRVVIVRSDLQHADFLTKPLHREAFCVHRNFVMNILDFIFLLLLYYLRKSCRGEYDVMILAAVRTYFLLFRGGDMMS